MNFLNVKLTFDTLMVYNYTYSIKLEITKNEVYFMKKQIHVISHSHWDREWYMPFEYHRHYLVKLIDDCMELFERDKDFRHFHLDGP